MRRPGGRQVVDQTATWRESHAAASLGTESGRRAVAPLEWALYAIEVECRGITARGPHAAIVMQAGASEE
ncbi:MAG TPA: hypothetical protein VFR95_12010 [Gemmatimonadaceae bacterium]|nr:hypothetical protein [Gemmatimonadaceae bacterium]